MTPQRSCRARSRETPELVPTLAAELSPSHGTSPLNFLGLLARLVSGGVFATWCMVAADACVRSGWAYFSVSHHVLGALGLYAMVGALLGLLATCLVWLEWRVVGRRLVGSERRVLRVRAAFYGAVGALASMSTALYTFSGEHVGAHVVAQHRPARCSCSARARSRRWARARCSSRCACWPRSAGFYLGWWWRSSRHRAHSWSGSI